MKKDPNYWQADRIAGLRRFAIAITALTVLGHTLLGFEQSYAQPLVALLTTYSLEFLLELLDARCTGRKTRFGKGFVDKIDFFLSAHITGQAVAMLIYANERLWVISFAAAVAISSKYIFRIHIGGKSRHFMNPSNLGISCTLILFPWVGIAPPYMFTENLRGASNWVLVCLIICLGSFLNWRFTKRLPLIVAFLLAFGMQAFLRSQIFGTPVPAPWLPMTGMAYLLFTFYMVSDPGTTPYKPMGQVLFGASVAFAYGLLMVNHIVFGLFFGLSVVCMIRGAGIYLLIHLPRLLQQARTEEGALPERRPQMAGGASRSTNA